MFDPLNVIYTHDRTFFSCCGLSRSHLGSSTSLVKSEAMFDPLNVIYTHNRTFFSCRGLSRSHLGSFAGLVKM
jgi:hypothetical protein